MLTLAFLAAIRLALGGTDYVTPGFAGFDPHQTLRSVGVFGSFGKGDKVQERVDAGLLAFTLKKDAPANTMVWSNYFGKKDLQLGQSAFPGELAVKQFKVLDWTTAQLDFTTKDGSKTQVYFSRVFPTVLYNSDAKSWEWKPKDIPFDRATYRTDSGQVLVAKNGESLARLGAPWVVLWNRTPVNGEVVCLLIRFEHRPSTLQLHDSLDAKFDGPIGYIAVMPLEGIRRGKTSWGESTPPFLLGEADFWSRASASFPVETGESFQIDEQAGLVSVTDRFKYREIHDDWGTKPLTIAPIPPVTAIAEAHGYPVHWKSGDPVRSGLATFLGPYTYVLGSDVQYTIPIPTARDEALSPLKVLNDPSRENSIAELNALVASHELKADDASDGGLNLQIKEYSQAYRLLNPLTRGGMAAKLAEAVDASYSPKNLQTVVDPVFGGKYVMSSKIWCVGEAYDREWYTGRQLDFTSEYTSWVNPNSAKKFWPAIQGLYAYYRIYNDWAWSGTLSSVFGYALCADGMNFAMEGMLGAARMARRYGDQELFKDATYRAAKEAVNTFASFYMSAWAASVDYATWTDTSYDYAAKKGRYEVKRIAPSDVQAGFGLDIFSDTTGIKVFRPGSFWHATAVFYWNNSSLYRLYDEFLYRQVYRWEFETMPRLFPGWQDRDIPNMYDNQKYGSNHAIVHIDGRANLFGDSAKNLAGLMTKLQPDIAFLYRLRAQQDLVEAQTPQVWLPTSQTNLQDASWNVSSKTLTLLLEGLGGGQADIDWNWRGTTGLLLVPDPGPKPKEISVNGNAASFSTIRGGFYRAAFLFKPGQTVLVRIRY